MKPVKDMRVPLEKGACVGEYIIESLLARGGSALTYFARKKTNGAKYVIKEGYPAESSEIFKRDSMIVTSGNTDLDEQKRGQIKQLFESEIEKANEYRCYRNNNSERVFEHENITNSVVIDTSFLGTVCSYICIDTSYGKTLYDIMEEDNLTLKNKFIYLRETAITLNELIHKRECIHADITPKNLFFPGEFKPEQIYCRIIDFGSAINLDNLNENAWLSYSEIFSSPEISGHFINRIYCGSDIYSLGMIMVLLLIGKESFSDSNCLHRLINNIDQGKAEAFLGFLEEDSKVLAPLITSFLKRCIYYDAIDFNKNIRPTAEEFIDEMNLYIDIIENRAFHPAVLAIGTQKNKPKELEKINILQKWLTDIKH